MYYTCENNARKIDLWYGDKKLNTMETQQIAEILDWMSKEYPERPIVFKNQRGVKCRYDEDPTEIICVTKVVPQNGVPGANHVVAMIDRSAPHVHKSADQLIIMRDGAIHLYWEDSGQRTKHKLLIPRMVHEIQAKTIHWMIAINGTARIEVITTPHYLKKDMVLMFPPDSYRYFMKK